MTRDEAGRLPGGPEDRLDSWKEIAAYLKRDVTTVQRWEKREGMPVHRHLHARLGSVYAFRAELDQWGRSRKLRIGSDEPQVEPAAPLTSLLADGGEPVQFAVGASLGSLGSPELREQRTAPVTGTGLRPAASRWWVSLAAAVLLVVLGVGAWLALRNDYFWRSPLTGASLRRLTDFDGTEHAAAISPDGKLVAFLSDRDGRTDVWMTQVGTGRFYNMTGGRFQELENPSVRTLGFSGDGSLLTFWARKPGNTTSGSIDIWAVPTLGGEPRPYLEGAAEYDSSADGSRLVYHTPGPGDPMFLRETADGLHDRRIFTAPPGVHAHFLAWSPDRAFIYFVQGVVPDVMDIWRVSPAGGAAERLTHHDSRVSHPVFVDRRTLLYLATDPDGDGPWLYSIDVERPVPHRLSAGMDRYTSIDASEDGGRLALTLAHPRETLWRLPISLASADASAVARIPLTTGRTFSPRLGPGYLLYASSTPGGDAIWKVTGGTAVEIWSRPGARLLGTLAIAPDGRRVAVSVHEKGKTALYVMNADGTGARMVTDALRLKGAPAWTPDGRSITTAVNEGGVPRLFSVALDGGTPTRLASEYSVDPVWSPDGRFVVYSGPDVGTVFQLKAVNADGTAHPLPNVTLTRGARRLCFLPGRAALVVMRGELQHKNLCLVDLETGAERLLTNIPRDFDVRGFDVSPDGREAVLHRVQEQSDVILLDLPRR